MRKFSIIFHLLAYTAFVMSQNYPESTLVTTNSLPFEGEFYTGFLIIDNATQSNLFYMLFGANNGSINNDAPLILWLQGGPGSPSEYGAFDELGPILLKNITNPTAYANPYSWGTFANLLFIDNPTGVGFSKSFGDLFVNSSEQSAVHLVVFLIRFYQIYPQLLGNSLYIFGESYAGHFIPPFVRNILANSSMNYIPLAGVGLGDAWVDPFEQTAIYSTFCYATGLVDQKLRDQLKKQETDSMVDIFLGDLEEATEVANDIMLYVQNASGGVDYMDYRDYEDSEDWESSSFYTWFNISEVQSMLGIPNMPYFGDNDTVYDNYFNDSSLSYADDVTFMLENLPVLVYVGQDDPNVGYQGVLDLLNVLAWDSINEFRLAPRVPWLIDGDVVGLVKQYGNLTFVTVNKAGHMVPQYQPSISQEMVNTFLFGNNFS